MDDLAGLLRRCEEDTRKLLSVKAAARLAQWRTHAEDSEAALIQYVQRLLRGEHRVNGWDLDRQGGLSLEIIVLDHRPDLFTDEDRQVARATLGRPA